MINIKDYILSVTNDTLDSLDMSKLSDCINSNEYKGYFNDLSSKEHYRLLSYISNLYNNISIIDIGTLKGCSALALSSNSTNHIYSFNIVNQLDLNDAPLNIQFIIDDIMKIEYKNIILNSPVILLDTFHDGVFEQKFLKYLLNISYCGVLLLDDIYLNQEMKDFWNSIDIDKKDISNIGHWSGTGVVFFYE